MANDTKQLKRTHKKPYKVGNLYFGRSSAAAGAKWIVSKSEDLSNPIQEFGVGKEARNYCDEQRLQARNEKKPTKQIGKGRSDVTPDAGGDETDAEVDINIPSDTGLSNILSEEMTDPKV